MKRPTATLMMILLLTSLAWTQSSPGAVPDYLGFYGLNIPGFSWKDGAQLEARYRRLSGTLDLTHTNNPLFLSEGHDPIPLTLDQTSRLLLAVDVHQSFDLIGIEGRATVEGSEKRFFVVFLAQSGEKEVNLVPRFGVATQGKTGGPPPRP